MWPNGCGAGDPEINKFLVSIEAVGCCVCGRVKHENLVLSNEFSKVVSSCRHSQFALTEG